MKIVIRSIVLLPILLVTLVILAAPAAAADIRTNVNITIGPDEVVNDDVYLVGSHIVINGTINGDAVCIGSTVTVAGTVNGNLNAAGSTIDISGTVTKSVRVAGSTVEISGRIDGDVVTAGDRISLADDAGIGRDLVFAAQSVDINSLITRGVLGVGSDVLINNRIGDDVDIRTTHLTIASSAVIGGDLTYTSENDARIESGAQISGTTQHNREAARYYHFPELGIWAKVIAFFMTLVTGIVVIALAPRRSKAVADSIRLHTLPSLGWGALALIATPFALVLVFVTIIGIPVSLIGISVYLLAIFLSQVFVGLFLGSWLLGYATPVKGRGMLMLAFALGFAILTLVKLIPYVGWAFWIGSTVFGMGAVLMSQRTLRVKPPTEQPTA